MPAAAWLDAWAEASPAAMPFLELLRSNRAVAFAELDEAAARGTGLLLNRSSSVRGVSRGTAHAVYLARTTWLPVLTADREAVIALDPSVDSYEYPAVVRA